MADLKKGEGGVELARRQPGWEAVHKPSALRRT
jgi:hypothetical protein